MELGLGRVPGIVSPLDLFHDGGGAWTGSHARRVSHWLRPHSLFLFSAMNPVSTFPDSLASVSLDGAGAWARSQTRVSHRLSRCWVPALMSLDSACLPSWLVLGQSNHVSPCRLTPAMLFGEIYTMTCTYHTYSEP